jgi:hypothetical protein
MTQSRHTNIAALKTEYSPSEASSLSVGHLEHFYNEKVAYYR